ncbi:MAG: AsmA family protein [Sphingomonadaceae bacterium]|nr:AsmA family protein [Sphingomonadaceae bacterium]
MARAKPILLWLALAGLALCAGALALLLVLPIDRLRPGIEARLTRQFGTSVTIARIARTGGSLLTPELQVTDLAIRQPDWAGSGNWAELRSARFRLALIPALFGPTQPQALRFDGLRLALVRAADGRANWRSGGSGRSTGLPQGPLLISDARIAYRDAKWDRRFDLQMKADAGHGIDASGTGTVRGAPVRIVAHGAAIAGGARWPFTASIAGPTLHLRAVGTMDRPLDSDLMDVDLDARADDLKTIDAIVEAGLFHSQPVSLRAHARHDAPDWRVTGLVGTVGRSHVAGDLTIHRQDGRTVLDGTVHADPFDFADLASSSSLTRAAAPNRSDKRRLIPATRVALDKLAQTDGALRFDARTMIGRGSPPVRSIAATLRLDHSLLTISPLRAGLTHGAVTGSLAVDQRGRALPLITIDAHLEGADLSTLGGGGTVDGRATGHVRLAGSGSTIRDGIGASNGVVALTARDGSLPARLASLLGLDLGHALTTDSAARSGLRCAVLRLDVRHGVGQVRRLLVDTTRAQTKGSGTIDLADERLAIMLNGAPKQHSLLKLPGAIRITGTLGDPHAGLPAHDTSPGAIVGAIGRAIAGKQAVARDADCAHL